MSKIRMLLEANGGGLAHCTLPPASTSTPVQHKSVDELWYFFQGRSEVWRKDKKAERIVCVSPGTCLAIPKGAEFQFRNPGPEPLSFIIATIPKWPDPHEAAKLDEGYWDIERCVVRRIGEIKPEKGACGLVRELIDRRHSDDCSISHIEIARPTKRHYHKHLTESYYVISGKLTVDIDGEVVRCSSGTLVNMKPGTRHKAWPIGGVVQLLVVCALPFDEEDEYFV
jgi:mannose-6-phosphate isomerase-like protein (cupin superfamily)